MSFVDVKVPAVGESITEVVVSQWLVAEGTAVKQDETLAALETDKVTVDLPAPETGAVSEILVSEGETAEVGAVLARIEVGAEGKRSDVSEAPAADEKAPGADEEAAAADEETPAADQKSPASAPSAPGATEQRRKPEAAVSQAAAPTHEAESRIMPAAARLLSEHGLAAHEVTGTGPGGRVLKEDVARQLESDRTEKIPSLAPGTAGSPSPERDAAVPPQLPVDSPEMRHEEVVPMTPLRKRVAERMVDAQQTAALLTTFNEIDMSEVVRLRKQHQQPFQDTYGIKLGFMSFFVKASVEALKAVPGVNAEIRDQSIVYRNYYDIGIAVGGGRGLVVPIMRNAERLSFAQIETVIADFVDRAKENRIELDELQGGTFTISNGGVYGSLLSTPIVNPPQSGVLGLHAIQDRPVVRDGEVVVRPMMYVALTYDHRVVDGREAVTFLKRVKTGVEEPTRILLEV